MGIRLLVADSHPVFLAGLQHFVAGTEIEIIGSAMTTGETLQMIAEHTPDVLLLSAQLADTDGLTVLEQIRHLHLRLPVVMLAIYDHPPYMARVRSAGGFGYLLKDFDRARFLQAIERVATGQQIWSREDTRRITGVLTATRLDAALEIPLTPRETDVLRAVVLGYSNRRIAEELGISYETVKEHIQHVLHKVGVADRTQAAVWAVRQGLA